MEIKEIKWTRDLEQTYHRSIDGEVYEMRAETVMQNYYDNGMSGIAIHVEGTNEEVAELEKEIRDLIKQKSLVALLKQEKE